MLEKGRENGSAAAASDKAADGDQTSTRGQYTADADSGRVLCGCDEYGKYSAEALGSSETPGR